MRSLSAPADPRRRADGQSRLRTGCRVLALLRTFNRESGQTVILVTNDAEVGQACDRVIRMRDGLIRGTKGTRHVAEGNPVAPAHATAERAAVLAGQ